MFKLLTDICVGILICTSQDHIDTSKNYLSAATYNECKVTMFKADDNLIEVKPFNGSLQESLVIKQCDHYTSNGN